MDRPQQVLVACSYPEGRARLLQLLTECGLEAIVSSSVREACAILRREPVMLVFCHATLIDGSFHDILQAAEQAESKVPVVVASRLDDTREYLEAMRLGAFDYIACPFQRAEVEYILSRVPRRVNVAA